VQHRSLDLVRHTPAVLLSGAALVCGCGAAPGGVDPGPSAGASILFEGPERVGAAAQAVEGGESDSGDNAVVGVAMTDGGGGVVKLCSGSLIAPNLVLTAQHCVAATGKYVNCDTTTFGPAVDPADLKITPSPSMWSPTATFWPGRELILPGGAPAVCGRDLALIVLVQPLPPERATPVDPRLEDLVLEGEGYTAVGYGNSGDGAGDSGLRRRRDGLVVECVGGGCGSAGGVDGREWRGNQGACSGDSGGPALDTGGHVIGVTSRGPFGCDSPIYGGLIAWRTWVQEAGAYAAKLGGYPPPAWVDGATGDGVNAIRSRLGDDTWSSCSVVAGPGRRTPAGAAIVLVGLALAAALRLGAARVRPRC
jgi:hypothetical protein